MRRQIEIPLQSTRFVRANWLTLFFQRSMSLRSYLFCVGLANEIEWSRNLAIFVISKIFISDIAWIVKWFVTRSDTMIGWGRLGGCHARHTNNPRLWWRLNQAHSRRRFRVSLPSRSVFVGSKKWKNSRSLSHLLGRMRAHLRTCLRMRQCLG